MIPLHVAKEMQESFAYDLKYLAELCFGFLDSPILPPCDYERLCVAPDCIIRKMTETEKFYMFLASMITLALFVLFYACIVKICVSIYTYYYPVALYNDPVVPGAKNV